MQKLCHALVGLVFCLPAVFRAVAVDPVWEYAVRVSATVQASPPSITLTWPQDTIRVPSSYTVYRKAPGATSWGTGTTLAGSATSYVDNSVAVGGSYEYQVVKAASGYNGYGYVLAGINAPLVENRGKLVLIVDNTHAAALAPELTRLQQDLAGDGWTVLRHDVARNSTVASVKNLIRSDYSADPANVKAVFLFGRVPVPYSGVQSPDGHPDHHGAWPADVFYGEMDGNWTDSSVSYQQTQNTDAAERARLSNLPGDGKFDQTAIPSAVELQVGRVDLSSMPGRTSWQGPATLPSELELLRRYLNKDHNFRHKLINPQRRAVLGDYFGSFGGEAFAASGFRSFAPLVGAANVTNLNVVHNDAKGYWIPHLAANDYLWAYGCGAGSYTTIGGLGNSGQYKDGSTVEIVNNDVRAVFTLLFGSWNGDWDHEDNILRSVLATPTYGLTAGWSGRPHWFLHSMGLGESIGQAARLTQNNTGLYRSHINDSAGTVTIALLGDPTLRLHPVAPPASLSGTTNLNSVTLSWSPSPDSVLGYHVYRSASPLGPFTRLTAAPVTASGFIDAAPLGGANTYMLRAVKLETGASGTYTNASQGLFWTIGNAVTPTVDSVPPVTSLTAPVNNAVVSGSSVSVSANASDNVGVVGVQFKLDGANLGAEDLVAPFSFTWNTASVANGPHTLTAVARDLAGNQTTATIVSVNVSNAAASSVVWIEDAIPSGAGPGASAGDAWNWVSNPKYSGTVAHQSQLSSGQHEHYFNWASTTLTPAVGETLFTYVYLDPANPPSELMLSWNADNWEHRAYWGANLILYGTDGTAGRRYMGALPAAGQWVRLEVPASQVALEGKTIIGMGFSLYNGRATWDYTGKSSQASTSPPPVTLPTVTVTASDVNAGETGANPGVFTISRTGNTTSALTVNYSLGGTAVSGSDYSPVGSSVSIPVGAASANVTVTPLDDALVEVSETITLTLSSNAAYIVGAPATTAITIADNDTIPGGGTNGTNNLPPPGGIASSAGYKAIELAKVGDNALTILSPTLLELRRVNTKAADPARVDSWDFVNASGAFTAPALSQFAVTVNGQAATVQSVGFRRRPSYAPLAVRDLRIDNCLYLTLASPIGDGQSVEVKNASGTLWPATMKFIATNDTLRVSPAIHVNQEGYVPSFQKKAMIGYYLGNLGEMNISASLGFKLVDANTGAQVHQGSLMSRVDVGYAYSPTPYQKVLEADFTSFTTPGEYRLVVPGLGASLPFRIDEGVAMAFTRAYALGLYHQRCGTNNVAPFTRHTHDVCHAAAAEVPSPASSFAYTWSVIAAESANYSENPRHTAPQLKDEASQRYPFINRGPIDVSRGHHDAGDYSKYTLNSAALVHYLTFTVDTVPGAAALDNLGLPESGNGVGDLLEIAKWEADFLAKMQDADGGFYFLVYPRNRRYENNVTPDHGDPQIVWPKTTAVSAAAVAALAQAASSPQFKQRYPAAATLYMQKAQLGWQFLTNAIARFGKDGSYQKITPYGDMFMHDDELAWAACEMFLATGNQYYHQKLKEWFPNPSDPATYRWGWWRLASGYGDAIRSYAFAARSGRLTAAQLDAAYLAKCETEIKSAANDALTWSRQNAYGTSFPYETKRVARAGWYFSSDHAADMATAYQLDPRPEYLQALVANMNYEGGCNPVNVSYVTGLGWKRQREIVHQYAQNDRRVLPPTGIPLGNVQESFYYMTTYQGELNALCFPGDWTTTDRTPFYDRWGDAYNVMTEFIHLNQARSLLMLSLLSSFTTTKSQAWTSGSAQIIAPTSVVPVGQPATITLQTPGLDLTRARVVWEGRDQEPAFGPTFSYTPKNNGAQWVEVEVQWPDGRRVFATNGFTANSPVVTWVDDAMPTGSAPNSSGESWNWVSTPTPFSGTLAHQSPVTAGLHQHYFDNATATLDIGVGDTLFAYVYLDPANKPTEVMLQWNDGSWEHRAYWGANSISYGNDGTASRRYMGALPTAGQWVRLEVPASAVGLEGRTLKGMAFTLYGGRATWDAAGKSSPQSTNTTSLRISSITRVGTNQLRITWPSTPGKTYRVAAKDRMTSGAPWVDVSGDITATGTTTSYTDTAPQSLQQRLYVVYEPN